jgi:hypothetical protein
MKDGRECVAGEDDSLPQRAFKETITCEGHDDESASPTDDYEAESVAQDLRAVIVKLSLDSPKSSRRLPDSMKLD